MKRPAKKKPQNPLLPEDGQIDERNLIDLEDAAEVSFEDRVRIYWMENKAFISGCISLLLFVVAAYQGLHILKQRSEAALQEAYATADADAALAEFAKANSDQPIGGFAALRTADEAYTAQDYATALEFYTLAAGALAEPSLAGRAQLGQAFASYQNGDTDDGLARLNAISADPSLAEAARAEAAYHLAIEADSAGNAAEFETYAAQINQSTYAGQWQQRLNFYQRQTR